MGDDLEKLNFVAWSLATALEDVIRDGKVALEVAKKACELSKWKKCETLDTLAAAYAEVGDFENAIRWQKESLKYVSPAQLQEYTAHLKTFESRKPIREAIFD